ncbi:hypothetical protein P171DRAFT_505111 [Karstenula rhodostoma CBS 690.94]|uniref:NAD(P)-binding protein n=1 Tax=Karstenula rhodostoma CBS 690.94 TaxID=1392251 RepID=A0A9P4P808_9PLEO|nr:hypothetical protein P171DRAFT_505111 [Karstenula rhodostoma CBS 690.94]
MPPLTEVLAMPRGRFGRTWVPNLNLEGKTVIVTGANTGLRLECVNHLARSNASRIILACRKTTCEKRTNIERVRTNLERLDAFIANAGVEVQEFQFVEGLELQLTVNVVSCFLSAISVLLKLRQTAEAYNIDTTLAFCGSMYHFMGPDAELDIPEGAETFDTLSDPKRTDIVWQYALSKLMVHHCYHKLATSLRNSLKQDSSRCETELSRAKPHPFIERVSFAVMGWRSER